MTNFKTGIKHISRVLFLSLSLCMVTVSFSLCLCLSPSLFLTLSVYLFLTLCCSLTLSFPCTVSGSLVCEVLIISPQRPRQNISTGPRQTAGLVLPPVLSPGDWERKGKRERKRESSTTIAQALSVSLCTDVDRSPADTVVQCCCCCC